MRCPECGGSGTATCGELFDQLLALDHSWQEPWGPLHSVAVACYRLQHESALPLIDRAHMLALTRAYVSGGEPDLHALENRVRRANSHRARKTGRPVVAEFGDFAAMEGLPAPRDFAYTIVDVAVDSDFPAAGYPARVRSWAEATLSGWQQLIT